MVYTLARIDAVLQVKVKEYYIPMRPCFFASLIAVAKNPVKRS